MDGPNSFRQPPKPKERLLSPERAKAHNDALARQVDRAQLAVLRAQRHPHGQGALTRSGGSLPWKYILPVVVGVASVVVFPRVGVDQGRSMLIGLLSALVLFAIAFAQDVHRWLSK